MNVEWSEWVPFAGSSALVPAEPGVYQVRVAETADIVYIGMSGERNRNGKARPKGLRARIKGYESGLVLTNGLGRAVSSRALRDPEFLIRIAAADLKTIDDLGRLIFEHSRLELRWTTTPDRASAKALEASLIGSHEGLWNLRRQAAVINLPDE